MNQSWTAFLLCAFWSASLHAQLPQPRPYIRASGNASVLVPPDQVKVDATVTTQGSTAQEASSQNANQVTAVIAALRKLLGAGADIKTINYSVGPVYKYPVGGTPTLTGYSASNTVEVTLSALTLAGAVIDTATQAGATSVGGLRFSLKDQEPARLQALRLATQQAKTHADAMASALGGRAGNVLSVQEGTAVFQPLITGVSASGPSTPTPVEPGLIQVQVTVVLEAELN